MGRNFGRKKDHLVNWDLILQVKEKGGFRHWKHDEENEVSTCKMVTEAPSRE